MDRAEVYLIRVGVPARGKSGVDDCGRRACSSNNHQSSIFLPQFPRDWAGTYYCHFDALGSVVGLSVAGTAAAGISKISYLSGLS